ncbi:hypothetical protein TTHERM_00237370 (macronuclear) [Tetrahymena thermophila SB210]|uniref:Uncharacterized protein n=1 Tax=Tetrahymena thermophila (strain SB210) TaxID=312017 RepID=I7M3Y1_TETTS|nr:hypothetical protein TTHERM_00237370 [Tetrahymena thermophila SB210]EAS04522.2 hypothetical protein TTHERM_00237370 [Tetrahymena thermophila SB210]|eukprot:XP_001024767.2 hypothetical protein TTHERM_00237370 [Tetrahymena thermophila SB210]
MVPQNLFKVNQLISHVQRNTAVRNNISTLQLRVIKNQNHCKYGIKKLQMEKQRLQKMKKQKHTLQKQLDKIVVQIIQKGLIFIKMDLGSNQHGSMFQLKIQKKTFLLLLRLLIIKNRKEDLNLVIGSKTQEQKAQLLTLNQKCKKGGITLFLIQSTYAQSHTAQTSKKLLKWQQMQIVDLEEFILQKSLSIFIKLAKFQMILKYLSKAKTMESIKKNQKMSKRRKKNNQLIIIEIFFSFLVSNGNCQLQKEDFQRIDFQQEISN